MKPITQTLLLLLTLLAAACTAPLKDKPATEKAEAAPYTLPSASTTRTVFPQIHTNLNGMVSEFVRAMHQDRRGNYWFGTNTNGLIRYDGKALEKMAIEGIAPAMSVRKIVEDDAGNVWFGTSEGLVKHDGAKFTAFSEALGLQSEEVWGLAVDARGIVWVGSTGGLSHFDGQTFRPFPLPESKVENHRAMVSDKLVLDIMQDKSGVIWLVTDGNGIFTYHKGAFTHLTAQNGLTDNSATDVMQDRHGNIWIGTFNGGASRFDGKAYAHFTRDGVIEGEEVGSFLEDSQGNVWFSAENHGVYRYDGTRFTRFTTADGLTTNVVLSMMEDSKGQIWLSSWQGLCLHDGQAFMNAKDKEPWTQ